VDMFGPADLTTLFTGNLAGMANRVFGASDSKNPVLVRGSPVSWISRDDPPFLILQGDKDTVVPLSQSQEFYERLVSGGVEATLVIVKNGTHGLVNSPNMQPARQELTQMMVRFFQKHLR
jgi:dipeptidyl aminopeptidase/acylaminoacyl peptidase